MARSDKLLGWIDRLYRACRDAKERAALNIAIPNLSSAWIEQWKLGETVYFANRTRPEEFPELKKVAHFDPDEGFVIAGARFDIRNASQLALWIMDRIERGEVE